MSAIQRPSSGRPTSSARPRRPYSAYTRKGSEEEEPKFEAPQTDREWWRAYLKVCWRLCFCMISEECCVGDADSWSLQPERLSGRSPPAAEQLPIQRHASSQVCQPPEVPALGGAAAAWSLREAGVRAGTGREEGFIWFLVDRARGRAEDRPRLWRQGGGPPFAIAVGYFVCRSWTLSRPSTTWWTTAEV